MSESVDAIKDMLRGRIVELCHKCLPPLNQWCGRFGNEWIAYNPRTPDDHMSRKGGLRQPALKVALTGNKGAWKDWRAPADKGDVLGLIMHTERLDFKDAMKWARDFLGLEELTPKQRDALKREAQMRQQRDDEVAQKARARKIERAMELWQQADPHGENPGAQVWVQNYFAARGCPLEAIATLSPRTFRFSSSTEWWKGAEYERANGGSRKVKPGPSYPALHSAMRAMNGAVTCCHVTFLDPVRPAKAPVTPAKLMLGEAMGSVIEIALGETLEPFWLCQTPGDVIIAEGIETAATLANAAPEVRVWAAGSLAGFAGCPVQLPCVGRIIIARDNNHDNPQAQKQLNAALIRLEEADKPIVTMASHVGDDFNDLTRE